MLKLKAFATERPILFSVAMFLLATVLTEVPLKGLFAPYIGVQAAHYLTLILEQGMMGIFFFILLSRFGWLSTSGFTPSSQWRALWLGWPLIIFTLINVEEGLVIDTSKPGLIGLHLLTTLSTGWLEEILGRGVVLTAFIQKWGRSRKGIYLAVLVSSALFGLAHLANFLFGRKPLLNTVTQILFALFFGVIFAACVLRNRTIWPMMLLHAAVDWAGTLDEISIGGGLQTIDPVITPTNALVSILITLPLFLYGLFILRKVEPDSLDLESIT